MLEKQLEVPKPENIKASVVLDEQCPLLLRSFFCQHPVLIGCSSIQGESD